MEEGADTKHPSESSTAPSQANASAELVPATPKQEETPRCDACGKAIVSPPTLVYGYGKVRAVQFERVGKANLCDTCGPLILEDRPTRKFFPQTPSMVVQQPPVINVHLPALTAADRPRRGTRFIGLFVFIAIVSALIFAGFRFWPQVQSLVSVPTQNVSPPIQEAKNVEQPTAVLKIESQPSGARITINGEEMGETPLAMDNFYPAGDIDVTLSRKGYKVWTGRFRGGSTVGIDAKLSRK